MDSHYLQSTLKQAAIIYKVALQIGPAPSENDLDVSVYSIYIEGNVARTLATLFPCNLFNIWMFHKLQEESTDLNKARAENTRQIINSENKCIRDWNKLFQFC